MLRRVAASLVPLCAVLAAGCFNEDVPSGTQIVCTANSDCPDGFLCRTSISRCVPASGEDQTPPVLDGAARLEPAVARAGVTLVVDFKVSEPLSADPVVRVEGHPTPLALDEAGTDRAALTYRFSTLVAGNEPQGRPVPVTVDLVDLQGNSAAGLSAGSATFDFVPPTVAIASPVSPPSAAAGVPVQVSFVPSEPLGADPVVSMTSEGHEPLALSLAGKDESGAYTFRFVPTGQEAAGAWQVAVVATDVAGNASQPIVLGTETLDFTAPRLLGATVEPELARPGQIVEVTVTLDETCAASAKLTGADGARSLAFDLLRQTGATLVFQHVAAVGEDGAWALTLSDAGDAAGNVPAPITVATLTVDGTAPALTGYTQSGDSLNGKDTLVVEFSATEELREEPLVKLGQRALARVGTTTAPYRFSLPLAGTGMVGDQDVQVAVVDFAGNSALLAPGVVQVDAIPPALVDAQFSPPVARLGITAFLTVTVSETLASTPAVAWQAPAGNPGFVYATRSGQAYTFAFPVTPSVSPGVFKLSAVSMTDAAGNDATVAVSDLGLAVDFTVDNVPPEITGLALDRERYSAQSPFDQVSATFQVSEALAADGLEALFGGRPAPCVSEATGYRCTYPVAGDEPEGPFLVRITATDLAGNLGFGSEAAAFDFTPPQVFGEATAVLSPAGCALSADQVSAATLGTSARLGFVVSEALDGDRPASVRLVSGAQEFAASFVQSAGFSFTYAAAVPAAGTFPQGAYELRVSLRDEVGNERDAAVPMAPPGFVLDTEPPAPPAVDTADAVVYQRVPWGFDEERSGAFSPKTFRLRSAAGAVDPDAAWVVAYDGSDPATAGEIGRAAAAQAAFGTMDLNRADRPDVFVAAFDAACNRSPPARVREVEWTATLGYKVAGSSFENPHLLATTSGFVGTLSQPGSRSSEAGDALLASVRALDGQSLVRAAEAAWEKRRFSGAHPTARERHSLVYDAARGRAVLFGGYSNRLSQLLQDTWEWDGERATWTERSPGGASPSSREGHAAAYDGARGRVVLFGGRNTGELQDTWEWDGADESWVERTSTGAVPPARHDHVMAWDERRSTVVLFGGSGAGGLLADTWEFDGATGTWTERTPAGGGPGPRKDCAVAFDPVRGVVVVFGGRDLTDGALQDTWEWDGAAGTWTERTPALGTSPSARSEASLAFDGSRGTLVLFGGNGAGTFSDLWEWDGATGTWAQLGPAGPAPQARGDAAMAYDSLRRTVVLFGGYDESWWDLEDTWEWHGSSGSWSERTPPSAVPGARSSHAMAFDGARRTVVLFGGTDGSPLADTWEWDGESGTWTDRTPAGASPPGRGGHAMAYDRARRKVVLFGGDGWQQDTWEWDGAAGTWTARTPTGASPAGRSGHAMVYDERRGTVVLFGGMWGLADTWEWDGAAGTWTDRTPAGASPPGRVDHAMAYDAGRGTAVLFGGVAGDYSYPQDTWEWDGASGTWTERTPTGDKPVGRMAPAMAYDGARGRVVLFGGLDNASSSFPQGLWEWDGASGAWTDRTPSGTVPSGRFHHAMAHDDARGRTVLFGGSGVDAGQDTWELSSSTSPGVTLRFALRAAGVDPSALLQSLSATFWAGGTSSPAGVEASGAELLAWDFGAWKVLAVNDASAAAPGQVEWITSDAALLSRLLLGSGLDFAVRPRPAGPSAAPARIAMDYAELALRYRLP